MLKKKKKKMTETEDKMANVKMEEMKQQISTLRKQRWDYKF